MKRLLLLALVACLCVSSAGAVKNNFQDWSNHTIVSTDVQDIPKLLNASTGQIYFWTTVRSQSAQNRDPITYTYAAYDYSGTAYSGFVNLLDSSRTILKSTTSSPCVGRREITIIGGSVSEYCNGVFVHTYVPVISTNPVYFEMSVDGSGGSQGYIDNVVIGETDHHIVGALPNNWSVVKDLVTPAAVGVYSCSPSTGLCNTLRNSNYFYIDADTDSINGTGVENLLISNSAGTVVNTTPINSATPLHQVQYNITQFLSDAATLGGSNLYGQYSVHFSGSGVYDYFTVIGNGASVLWGSKSYNQGDAAAVVYYTTTDGHWDTSQYSYKLNIISANDGSVKQSTPILASSGTVTYSFTTSDDQGVYYAALIATRLSDKTQIWMNYDYTQLNAYVVFTGFVKDAQTALAISGAYVNMTQSSTAQNSTTGFDGNYTSAQFLTGANIYMNTTATGYGSYFHQVAPLRTGTIALNITLMPSSPAYTGDTLGGIAREPPYNRTIDSATVTIGNTTAPYGNYSVITNSAGYYQQINMPNNYLWDIVGSKSGFSNSATYRKLVVGV